VRRYLIIAAAVFAAAPLPAQRGRAAPPRPSLGVNADTNSAEPYMELGRQSLATRPDVSLAAFYWAWQLDPTRADALYGRHVAELMSNPQRLVQYMEGRRSVVRSPEVQRIDSLYFRALTMDPFLYRRYETDLIRTWLRTLARAEVVRGEGPQAVDEAAISHWISVMLQHAPPALRAQSAYGSGRFNEALQLYDEALRQARRKSPLRTERARLLAQLQRDSAAAAELTLALADLRGEDERDVVYLYESKALLEYGVGRLHERMGHADAAREAYGRALAEDLSFYPAHLHLGIMAFTSGDTATMQSELDLASQFATRDPGVGYVYGIALAQSGQLARGEAQLETVTAQAPYFADPFFALANVRERQGDGPGALDAYRAFLTRAPRAHARRPIAESRIRELDLSAPAAGADQ
jgi:tetratricopeptide (TPR) repeat protein